VLRAKSSPYTVIDTGEVQNRIRVKVVNRDEKDHRYTIKILDLPEARIKTAQNPLDVAAGQSEVAGLFVIAPASEFPRGRREITLEVTDGEGFRATRTYQLLGPYWRGPAKKDGDQ
jgi:hypothetical protein